MIHYYTPHQDLIILTWGLCRLHLVSSRILFFLIAESREWDVVVLGGMQWHNRRIRFLEIGQVAQKLKQYG